MNAETPSRRGFALLAVLWVVVSAAALGLTVSLVTRESVGAVRNRMNDTRAMWRAEGCLERARASIADRLTQVEINHGRDASAWLTIDSVVAVSPLLDAMPCHITMRAAGTSLDVNAADAEMLRALLAVAGVDASRADSMTDALLDWRDPDDLPRPLGAEGAWYVQAGRVQPRNGPFADARELRLVRGFEMPSALDTLLDVEGGRIPLAIAPLPVIAALPGVGAEALSRIAERRLSGTWPVDPMTLSAALSPSARETLLARFAELSRWTTPDPDAWILASRGSSDGSAVRAVVEVRLVRAGTRAAIVRRRSWVE
jgi:general secretion pathway protein K